jgi:hypothetical protein
MAGKIIEKYISPEKFDSISRNVLSIKTVAKSTETEPVPISKKTLAKINVKDTPVGRPPGYLSIRLGGEGTNAHAGEIYYVYMLKQFANTQTRPSTVSLQAQWSINACESRIAYEDQIGWSKYQSRTAAYLVLNCRGASTGLPLEHATGTRAQKLIMGQHIKPEGAIGDDEIATIYRQSIKRSVSVSDIIKLRPRERFVVEVGIACRLVFTADHVYNKSSIYLSTNLDWVKVAMRLL